MRQTATITWTRLTRCESPKANDTLLSSKGNDHLASRWRMRSNSCVLTYTWRQQFESIKKRFHEPLKLAVSATKRITWWLWMRSEDAITAIFCHSILVLRLTNDEDRMTQIVPSRDENMRDRKILDLFALLALFTLIFALSLFNIQIYIYLIQKFLRISSNVNRSIIQFYT